MRLITYPTLLGWARFWYKIDHGLRGKPNIYVLKREYRKKMTPNDLIDKHLVLPS